MLIFPPTRVNPRVGSRVINGQIVAFNCQNQIVTIWNEAAGDVWSGLQNGEARSSLEQFHLQRRNVSSRRKPAAGILGRHLN